jgi:hypothetical protein
VIHRRTFLNSLLALGGARALPAFANPPLPHQNSSSADSVRQPPLHPLSLASRSLTVTLDARDGLPYRYDFAGQTLWGEDSGAPIQAILCRLQPKAYSTVAVILAGVRREAASIVFRYDVPWQDRPGASFSLRYSLDGASLVITQEDVVEHPGFELIEVALPSLATVREEEPQAWMAQGRNGGSFVRVAKSKPFRFKDDDNFGRVSTQLPIGMVGSRSIACMLEVTAFMDATETNIFALGNLRRASIGTIQVHRVHGGRCYNMNDGADAVCGTPSTPNLLVGQPSRCRLDFFAHEDADSPWFTGAKLLRARMPTIPTHYFDDKLLYLIAGKQKVLPAPQTTFAQSARLIAEIANLTDFAPQVAYISGWVYDGQDTGYPSEDVVNPTLGTYDELLQLMQRSCELNANVSVNVNYDDAYKSSPLFDPAFIAREPNGSLWKSRAWDGEPAYIVGMAKFVKGGWARRRIAATMARYKLRHTMLIDALSWFTIRNDWDPTHPASGYKNLVDGKWVVLDSFRRRGIEVASEQFRYPMLGKLSLSVNGPEPRACPFGGDQIPLTAIVYRKATIFGGEGDGVLRPAQSLFWNSRPGLWFEHKSDRRDVTDFYFLVALPYSKVHALDANSYKVHGSTRVIQLEQDSKIAMDIASPAYSVVWNGAIVTQNEQTTCPIDDRRIAFYAHAAARLSYPLPPHWDAATVTARRMTIDGRQPHPVHVVGGSIVVDTPARVPIVVYSTKEAITGPPAIQ